MAVNEGLAGFELAESKGKKLAYRQENGRSFPECATGLTEMAGRKSPACDGHPPVRIWVAIL